MKARRQTGAGSFGAVAAFALTLATAGNAYAACTTPSGNAGDIVYSSSSNLMAYCNGSSWITMGSAGATSFGTLTSGDFCTATSGSAISCTTATINLSSQASGTLLAAQFPALTGDVTTIAGTLTTAIGANKVTMGDIAQVAGLSVLGNAGASTGNVSAITGTANQVLMVNSGGTGLTFGTLSLGSSMTGVLPPANGGTGVNNGTNAITLGGGLTTSGAYPLTLTLTGSTNVTLPTSGTLVTTATTSLPNLVSIGTVTSGTWDGNIISPTYGGTGVNNGSYTTTLGGNFVTSGGAITLTATGGTNVTLPTSGTLVSTTTTSLPNLATVGTITTGVWNGTAITVPYGGTGLTSLTSNAIYKGNGTSAMSASSLSDNGTIVSTTENIDMGTKGVVTEIANAATPGTTVNALAKLSAGKAIVIGTTDTDGVVGVVIGSAGTTGNAQIAFGGQAACVFDGATTAGDYVQISTTTAGDCHDTASATRPSSGQELGRVLSTNGSGGTYSMTLDMNPSAGSSGTTSGTGTANYVTKWTGTTTLGSSILYDTGSSIGIDTTSPIGNTPLDVEYPAPTTGSGTLYGTYVNLPLVNGGALSGANTFVGISGTASTPSSGTPNSKVVNTYGVQGTANYLYNSGAPAATGVVAGGYFTGAVGTGGIIVPKVAGVRGTLNVSAGGVTSGYGGYFDIPSSGGGVTTGYGVYTGSISATTPYAIYTSDSSPIYFGGNVGIGSTSPASSLDLSQKNDAIILPSGTSANRPTGVNGMIRYNSSTPAVEALVSGTWQPLATGSGGVTLGTLASATSPQRSGEAGTGFYTAGSGLVDVAQTGTQVAEFSSGGLNLAANTAYKIGSTNAFKFPNNNTANTAVGNNTMASGTGDQNTAVGSGAMANANSASYNVGVGVSALGSITTGQTNTAVGRDAAASIQDAQNNVAFGNGALYADVSGNGNAVVGTQALHATTAANNSVFGNSAGYVISSGANNLVLGESVSLSMLTTGSANILIGTDASTDTPASSTSNWMNIGNAIYGQNLYNTTYNPSGVPQIAIGSGLTSVTAGAVLDLSSNKTSANSSLLLPQGSSTTRPTGVNGMIRYNTATPGVEAYVNSAWITLGSSGGGTVSGTGTANYVARWTGTGTLSTGVLMDNGTDVAIGTTLPSSTLQIGTTFTNGDFSTLLTTQNQINDIPTTTTAGSAATQTIMTEPAPASNSTVAYNGQLIDVIVPSSSSVSYTTLRGATSVVNYAGTGGVTSGGAFFNLTGVTGNLVEAENTSTATVKILRGYYDQTGNGSGTVTDAFGAELLMENGAGTMSNAYGIYDDAVNTSGGTIGNGYGVYITGWGAAGGTWSSTAYDLYAADVTASNYFAGKVGIGSSLPVSSLDLSQETDAIILPTGNSTNRPTAVAGMIRYNSSTPGVEAYVGSAWVALGSSGGGGGTVSGTGTTNYVAKWTGSTALGSSILYDNGTNVAIGTTSPLTVLQTNAGDNISIGTSLMLGPTPLPIYVTSTADIATLTNPTQANTIANLDDIVVNPTANQNSTVVMGRYTFLDIPSTATNGVAGLYGDAVRTYNSGSANLTYLLGVHARAYNYGTGTVAQAIGVTGSVSNANNGSNQATTITTASAVVAYSDNETTAGIIGTQYGVDSQVIGNVGTITNGYGVYVAGEGVGGTWTHTPYDFYGADTGAYNYFAGSVGIGTTSPVNALDVAGGVAIGTSYAGVKTAPTNGMIVQGNVGIGTSNATTPLTIQNSATYGYVFSVDDPSGFVKIGLNLNLDAGELYMYNSSGGLGVDLEAGAASYFNGGNVGIGTASPQAALHIGTGYAEVSAANSGFVIMTSGTQVATAGSKGWLVRGEADTSPFTGLSDSIDFEYYNGTALTQGPVFTAAGYVGLGSTAPRSSLDLSQKTDAIILPSGTSANRPTAVAGMIRYNTATPGVEAYVSGAWMTLGSSGGGGSLTWPLAGAADSVTAPDYAWSASTNTGLYYNSGIGFTVGGVAIGVVNSTGINISSGSLQIAGVNGVSFPKDFTVDASIAIGSGALASQTANGTTVQGNIAIGYQALGSTGLTTGATNSVAIGYQSLTRNTWGNGNAAIGWQSMAYNTTGTGNVALGNQALYSNSSAGGNTAVGYQVMQNTSSGGGNSVLGYSALSANTSGAGNVGVGYQSLVATTDGGNNVAVGYQSLYSNVHGANQVAVGYQAAYSVTSPGSSNTIVGNQAGYYITTGTYNDAFGYQALYGVAGTPLTGSYNVAVGDNALTLVQGTATSNTAVGFQAAYYNSTGGNNTSIGYRSLFSAVGAPLTGSYNVGVGNQALYNIQGAAAGNTAMGYQALYDSTTAAGNSAFGYQALYNVTGTYNVGVGYQAGIGVSTAADNTAIGYQALDQNNGADNTAVGYSALYYSQGGQTDNTVVGSAAMYYNKSGSSNTIIGYHGAYGSGFYTAIGNDNVAIGAQTMPGTQSGAAQNVVVGDYGLNGLSTGANNVTVGYKAGYDVSSGSNNIVVGPYVTTGVGVSSGSSNILIGYDVRPPSTTGSNQLNIGNLIYATGIGTAGTISTGSVGIGTASPMATFNTYLPSNGNLLVSGANEYSGMTVGFHNPGNGQILLGDYSNGDYLLFSNGAVNTVGNWYLSSPTYLANTGTSSGNATSLMVTSTGVGDNQTMYLNTYEYAATNPGLAPLLDIAGNGINFGVRNGNPWNQSNAGNIAMSIGTSGNVGIGSTTPAASLDLSQKTDAIILPMGTTTNRPSTGVNGMIRYNSSTPGVEALVSGTWTALGGAAALSGLTGATATNSIDSATNAQTWTWNTLATQTAMTLSSSATGTTGVILNVSTASTAGAYAIKGLATGASGVNYGVYGSSTSPTGYGVYSNGNLGVAGNISYSGVIADTSDRRLKSDILPLSQHGDMLDMIDHVKTYSYRLTADKQKQIQYGVMAQELEPIFPDLVLTAHDKMGTKSVNYTGLIAPLISAVQEQQTEIDELKAANENLKQEIELLKKDKR